MLTCLTVGYQFPIRSSVGYYYKVVRAVILYGLECWVVYKRKKRIEDEQEHSRNINQGGQVNC